MAYPSKSVWKKGIFVQFTDSFVNKYLQYFQMKNICIKNISYYFVLLNSKLAKPLVE